MLAKGFHICKICKEDCGFWSHGHYSRNKIDEQGDESNEEISRYLCRKHKDKYPTFSCLPEELIPYRQYSLFLIFKLLMEYSCSEELPKNKRLEKAVNIEGSPKKKLDITQIHIYSFERLIQGAIDKISIITKKTICKIAEFIEYCNQFKYEEEIGVLAISRYFFQISERFLFGVASQHRKPSILY